MLFRSGELYEFNPVTLDARISGSTASLCGCERALQTGDTNDLEQSIRRILLIHAMVCAEPGIPMIYSGDEIGMLNDWSYKQVPAKCMDTRWLHRPAFDWSMAKTRHDPTTYAGRIFVKLSRMIQVRKTHDIFDAAYPALYLETENKHLFTWIKQRADDALVVLANFTETDQVVDVGRVMRDGKIPSFTEQSERMDLIDLLTGRSIDATQNALLLQPYEYLWLYQKR